MRCQPDVRWLVAGLVGLVALQACESDTVGPAAGVGPIADDREIELAIVDGMPDGNGHPNVGVLAFDLDGEGNVDGGPNLPPFGRCTGSVLSDHVFLTAAHCIEGIPSFAQWAVTLEPGSPEDPVVPPGVFPDRTLFPVIVPVVYADQVVIHPQFDGDPPSARRHDVAVLLFPRGTFAGVTPVELPEEGELDELAAGGGLLGQSFTLVGYGAAPIPGEVKRYSVLGYRQVAEAPFRGLSRDWLHLLMTGAATEEGGLCIADSGSPHFLGESNVAMAILGGGGINEVCGTGVARSQRLDTPAELDFLAAFLEES